MVDNRPCEFTLGSYVRLHGKLCAYLLGKGKVTFANGPYCPAIQRHMDGVMAEGTYEQLAYFGLAKPVVLFQQGEEAFKWCLKFGAFPHVAPIGRSYGTFHLNEDPLPPDQVEVYKRYLPLVEILRGRTWVLSAHALTLPPDHDGNVFRTREGDYAVTVMSNERSMLEGAAREEVEVRVRPPVGETISAGELRSVDWPDVRPLDLARKDRDVFFKVPRYMTAGVALLATERAD
jgi:hypothetical protein